jgi:hypothetical protein
VALTELAAALTRLETAFALTEFAAAVPAATAAATATATSTALLLAAVPLGAHALIACVFIWHGRIADVVVDDRLGRNDIAVGFESGHWLIGRWTVLRLRRMRIGLLMIAVVTTLTTTLAAITPAPTAKTETPAATAIASAFLAVFAFGR